MIGFRVGDYSTFFDRPKVKAAVNRSERKALSNFGARVRTRGISSILRHPVRRGFGVKSKISNRDGVSPVGTPPFAHVGHLVRFTRFDYDFSTRSVIIGPALLNGVRAQRGALRTLEEGGGEQLTDRKGRTRRAHYRPRPWMGPAFQTELPQAAKQFENTVTN